MTIWMKRILCGLLAVVMGLMGPLSAYAQTVVYFHNDPAGSPIAATDASGNVLWRESYRPYGERMLKPAAANTQWFHGKSLDPDTGMEDFGARNYDPVLGRFLSIDPVDFTEKNIHSFNRYAYGNNNPLKYKDPDGRWAQRLLKIFSSGPQENSTDQVRVIDRGSGSPMERRVKMDGPINPPGLMAIGLIGEVPGARASGLVAGPKINIGRTGGQARLRELADDDKIGSADRGWIKQEMNSIERGTRSRIRNPPGKDLAHERGREAAKGYDYEHSNLQDRDLHRLQHKYDDNGRANTERPSP